MCDAVCAAASVPWTYVDDDGSDSEASSCAGSLKGGGRNGADLAQLEQDYLDFFHETGSTPKWVAGQSAAQKRENWPIA